MCDYERLGRDIFQYRAGAMRTIYDESRYTRKRGRSSPRPHISADVNEKDAPFARAKIFQAFGVFDDITT